MSLKADMNNFKEIDEILKEIKKNDVDAVYLFGSYATGKVKPISDVDICVTESRFRLSNP